MKDSFDKVALAIILTLFVLVLILFGRPSHGAMFHVEPASDIVII